MEERRRARALRPAAKSGSSFLVLARGMFFFVVAAARCVLGRVRPAFARLLCQTFRDPFAICSIDRPLAADRGFSSRISSSLGDRPASSSCLMSSQLSRFSPGLRRMRTRCQPPWSFLPSSVNARWPFARPLWGSLSGNQWPRSQTITVPPPYSPFGMVPSNVL